MYVYTYICIYIYTCMYMYIHADTHTCLCISRVTASSAQTPGQPRNLWWLSPSAGSADTRFATRGFTQIHRLSGTCAGLGCRLLPAQNRDPQGECCRDQMRPRRCSGAQGHWPVRVCVCVYVCVCMCAFLSARVSVSRYLCPLSAHMCAYCMCVYAD
jgi:hypothetical protein